MVEEGIVPVAEVPVERAMKPAAQTTPQLGVLQTATVSTSQLESTTTTTTTTTDTAILHAAVTPGVVPVEPMPSPIPGVPSPYHAVDFCVPVGADFSLVNGLYVFHSPDFCLPKSSNISTTDRCISSKFGLCIDFDVTNLQTGSRFPTPLLPF